MLIRFSGLQGQFGNSNIVFVKLTQHVKTTTATVYISGLEFLAPEMAVDRK
jgi:hypothetical protein